VEPEAQPIEAVVADGAEPPPEIPPEIFRAAVQTVLDPRRLDMRRLALELGIGRATLYRKVGSRERLLGEVLWYLMRRAVLRALDAAEELGGVERIVTVTDRFLHDVHAQPGLRRFLDAEPECALKVLTSRHGVVQRRTIDVVERLLAQEQARGAVSFTLDRSTLAYVIVRIGESFLYADVIADSEPDVDGAVEVIATLLRASSAPARRNGRPAA
jgi:AcrR family transcriptional regulator